MIGHVDLHDNLYTLKEHTKPTTCNSSFSLAKIATDVNSNTANNTFGISHFRLGHPSSDVLHHVSTMLHSIKI